MTPPSPRCGLLGLAAADGLRAISLQMPRLSELWVTHRPCARCCVQHTHTRAHTHRRTLVEHLKIEHNIKRLSHGLRTHKTWAVQEMGLWSEWCAKERKGVWWSSNTTSCDLSTQGGFWELVTPRSWNCSF